MPIKHLLIDLDDTILDFHAAEAQSLRQALITLGVLPTEDIISDYSEINRMCWEALERGEMTRAEVLVNRFKILFEKHSLAVDATEAKMTYEKLLSGCAIMMEGAEALINSLRGKYTLSIASNGTATVQDSRIAKWGMGHLFDHIFISEKVGADKPSPKFFEGCLRALGNPPKDEVMIIGDSMSSDIKGGALFGIHTCHFNKRMAAYDSELTPEYTVSDLSEIPALLEKINNL